MMHLPPASSAPLLSRRLGKRPRHPRVTGPPPATAQGGSSSRRYGAGNADPDTTTAAGRSARPGARRSATPARGPVTAPRRGRPVQEKDDYARSAALRTPRTDRPAAKAVMHSTIQPGAQRGRSTPLDGCAESGRPHDRADGARTGRSERPAIAKQSAGRPRKIGSVRSLSGTLVAQCDDRWSWPSREIRRSARPARREGIARDRGLPG